MAERVEHEGKGMLRFCECFFVEQEGKGMLSFWEFFFCVYLKGKEKAFLVGGLGRDFLIFRVFQHLPFGGVYIMVLFMYSKTSKRHGTLGRCWLLLVACDLVVGTWGDLVAFCLDLPGCLNLFCFSFVGVWGSVLCLCLFLIIIVFAVLILSM